MGHILHDWGLEEKRRGLQRLRARRRFQGNTLRTALRPGLNGRWDQVIFRSWRRCILSLSQVTTIDMIASSYGPDRRSKCKHSIESIRLANYAASRVVRKTVPWSEGPQAPG